MCCTVKEVFVQSLTMAIKLRKGLLNQIKDKENSDFSLAFTQDRIKKDFSMKKSILIIDSAYPYQIMKEK